MKRCITALLISLMVFLPFTALSKSALSNHLSIDVARLDFKRCTPEDLPVLRFTATSTSSELLTVSVQGTEPWIHVSPSSFSLSPKESTQVQVSVAPQEVIPREEIYQGKVQLDTGESLLRLPVRLDLVPQRVVIELKLDHPSAWINGEEVITKPMAAPYVRFGESRLPVRLISEAFGANVAFEIKEQEAIRYYHTTIEYKDWDIRYVMQMVRNGSTLLTKNDQPITLDYPWDLNNGRYFATLTFFRETFDPMISYDAGDRTFTITY